MLTSPSTSFIIRIHVEGCAVWCARVSSTHTAAHAKLMSGFIVSTPVVSIFAPTTRSSACCGVRSNILPFTPSRTPNSRKREPTAFLKGDQPFMLSFTTCGTDPMILLRFANCEMSSCITTAEPASATMPDEPADAALDGLGCGLRSSSGPKEMTSDHGLASRQPTLNARMRILHLYTLSAIAACDEDASTLLWVSQSFTLPLAVSSAIWIS
mmetsp:Transcript_12680/g.31634  ORF Transcript_12680/g.31634 Transcript_12680/m.31634 type:complete len:212 (+) Transcript_12680:1342-1977(+)